MESYMYSKEARTEMWGKKKTSLLAKIKDNCWGYKAHATHGFIKWLEFGLVFVSRLRGLDFESGCVGDSKRAVYSTGNKGRKSTDLAMRRLSGKANRLGPLSTSWQVCFLSLTSPCRRFQSNIILSFAWKGTVGSCLGISCLSAKGLPVAQTLWYITKHVPATVQTVQFVLVVHSEFRWTLLQKRSVFHCWEHCLIQHNWHALQIWLLPGYNLVLRISHRLVLHLRSCLRYIYICWCWQGIATRGKGTKSWCRGSS